MRDSRSDRELHVAAWPDVDAGSKIAAVSAIHIGVIVDVPVVLRSLSRIRSAIEVGAVLCRLLSNRTPAREPVIESARIVFGPSADVPQILERRVEEVEEARPDSVAAEVERVICPLTDIEVTEDLTRRRVVV